LVSIIATRACEWFHCALIHLYAGDAMKARLKTALACVLYVSLAASASAQAVDDAVLLAKHEVVVGSVYFHDTWDQYWEGTLKRDNGNIGTLTTKTNVWFANYGVTDRITVIGAIPHVWTSASQGVLHSVQGFQDLSLAVKYRLFEHASTPVGPLRAVVVASGAQPMTNYTPDFYPLSIGSGSRRISGRFTASAQPRTGWMVTGSSAYTWRGDVTLDRPFYYTDDQFFLTDEVDLSNVFDFTASVAYARGGWLGSFGFSQQWTLGGGDIRRQDTPFVSNRMNLSKVGVLAMVPVPGMPTLAGQVSWGWIPSGRNVGQSTVLAAGLVYRLPFGARPTR
jgi:hypothetical protein